LVKSPFAIGKAVALSDIFNIVMNVLYHIGRQNTAKIYEIKIFVESEKNQRSPFV